MTIPNNNQEDDASFSEEESKYDKDQDLKIYLELIHQMKSIDQLYVKGYSKKKDKKPG